MSNLKETPTPLSSEPLMGKRGYVGPKKPVPFSAPGQGDKEMTHTPEPVKEISCAGPQDGGGCLCGRCGSPTTRIAGSRHIFPDPGLRGPGYQDSQLQGR
jgi:hypothetical protein